jgi:hypothetical protein
MQRMSRKISYICSRFLVVQSKIIKNKFELKEE